MSSGVDRLLLEGIWEDVKAGSEYGMLDGESLDALTRRIIRFISTGELPKITRESLQLYDVPGADEYAATLAGIVLERCNAILELCKPSQT
jgi:hypothetical protein